MIYGSKELIGCIDELSSIIRELEDIENHVRHDFKNVGNAQCADSIQSVTRRYKSALRTLRTINPYLLDEMAEKGKV